MSETPVGKIEMRTLPNLWELVERLWVQAEALDPDPKGGVLTARIFDLAQPSGHRVYIAANRYLAVAMDNHLSLKALLLKHGVSNFAPWNLMRPTMEAAFYAAWVLDPRDGAERRKRAARLEIIDWYERRAWLKEWEASPEVGRQVADAGADNHARVWPLYEKMCREVGLPWPFNKSAAKVVVLEEIGKLSAFNTRTPEVPGHMFKAAWRILSGFQHGYGYPMMQNSEIGESVPIPGGANIFVTVKDDAFESTALLSTWMLWKALDLFIRRSTRTD